MKRYLLLVLALAVFGCGDQQTTTTPTEIKVATKAAEPAKEALPPPNFATDSKLGLARVGDRPTKVGMTLDEVLAHFAKPPTAYEKTDLPPSLVVANQPNQTYDAWGWQAKGEGFGAILYKGRLAAAVYQHEHMASGQVDDLLRLYEENFETANQTVLGKHVRYWFWMTGTNPKAPDQILMICSTEVVKDKFNVTAAVGVFPVMDALGMTFDAASRDQIKADNMIEKQRTGPKGNSSNSPNREGH